MPDLRGLLEREAARARISSDGLRKTIALAKRKRRNRQIVSALVALSVTAGGLAAVSIAFLGNHTTPLAPSGTLAQPQVMMSTRMISSTTGWGLRTDPATGIAKYVMRTTDGGLHWADVTPAVTAIPAAEFMSASRAWVVSLDGLVPGQISVQPVRVRVFRTGDGGSSWQSSLLPGLSCVQCDPEASMSFADAQHGWVSIVQGSGPSGSSGEVYATSDGGATWHLVGDAPFDGAIRFVSASEGWGVDATGPPAGRTAGLYRTLDGGGTWLQVSVRLPASLPRGSSPEFPEPPTFYGAVGVLPVLSEPRNHRTGESLTFFLSRDGGATWTSTTPVRDGDLVLYGGSPPITIESDRTWAIPSGAERLNVTNDAGTTWSEIRPHPADIGILQTGSLDFVTPDIGYAVLPRSSCPGVFTFCASSSTVYRTADGGRTWSRSIEPSGAANPDSNTAWGRYLLRAGGKLSWTLRYPSSWHVQHFQAGCGDWGGPGVFVSNVHYTFRNVQIPGGCTNTWDFSGLPASAVAVDLQPSVAGPRPVQSDLPDTSFPIGLGTPIPAPTRAPTGQQFTQYFLPLVVHGAQLYEIHVWIGDHAGPSAVQVAQEIVAAIRPGAGTSAPSSSPN